MKLQFQFCSETPFLRLPTNITHLFAPPLRSSIFSVLNFFCSVSFFLQSSLQVCFMHFWEKSAIQGLSWRASRGVIKSVVLASSEGIFQDKIETVCPYVDIIFPNLFQIVKMHCSFANVQKTHKKYTRGKQPSEQSCYTVKWNWFPQLSTWWNPVQQLRLYRSF